MSSTREDINFPEEIALLESMFGETVSSSVIATVIDSCNGNVNLAADAIMNFSEITPSSEESAKESSNDFALPGQVNQEKPSFQQLLNSQEKQSNRQEPLVNTQDEPSDQQKPLVNAQEEPLARQQPLVNANLIPQEVQAPTTSYSETFRNTGAVPKRPSNSKHSKPHYQVNAWPDSVKNILTHHNQGTRTLVLMRGAAGSGKTYLARHIVDYTVGASSQNYARHIYSTDSFFMRGGVYQYNRNSLEEAHIINQKKVCEATNKGISPIIVDNTNTEIWEMEPYTRDGVRNGYVIEIVEPNTPWARNVCLLAQKNSHGVPRESIRRMLDRYNNNITTGSLFSSFRLRYPANRIPPVKRNIPPISSLNSLQKLKEKTNLNILEYNKNDSGFTASSPTVKIFHHKSPDSPDGEIHSIEINNTACGSDNMQSTTLSMDARSPNIDEDLKLKKIIEAQKKYEQFEEIEKEWDNGESWDGVVNDITTGSQDRAISLDPKPPRTVEKNNTEKLFAAGNICDDWTKIAMFMPPWQDNNALGWVATAETPNQVETKSVATCFEFGDFSDNTKILYGESRNINEAIVVGADQLRRSKIPKVIMLDKSTSTYENDLLTIQQPCKHKERHFKKLTRIFRNIPVDILRDIFESCNCDADWSYNLITDSTPENVQNLGNNKNVSNETISDSDDDEPIDCSCLAAYNIIPNMVSAVPPTPVLPAPEQNPQNTTPQKKPKKEIKISESSLQLKRQIESNVMISDNHYSQHYLNTRRRREFNYNGPEKANETVPFSANTENAAESGAVDIEHPVGLVGAAGYNYVGDIAGPSTSQYNFQFLDSIDSDTESDSNKSDDLEKTVLVNLGAEFLKKIDELFGRKNFQYPQHIRPLVSLPMSILRQINAHWAMSIASQLDDGSLQSEEMIQQDEDFARQLAAKEQEMSEEGKEPDVPTLKEIMDMELAYSIYEKNIAEWRNNEPQDLAARLSREKLYNLFPDLSKEVLSEMLMAHDYSFKDTVESLLISTGQSQCLEDEKGIEKFVMRKEMERKEKFLEEENKHLSEEQWPYLSDPEKPITLDTVNFYRAEAEKYLQYRNTNFEKARQYFANNSPYAASFYSEIAALHTRKYEQSSCLAAAYLMKYHLKNNPDRDVLDLHFLRVAEAMVNLDIFLDQIILKLRNSNTQYKETWIITGKGQHSKGGPRIKPATKRRLKVRDIASKQVNGGLLMVTLHPTHKMTSELEENS